jgi:DNA invertase Pin-like site-specific DNA recombinase
MKLIGYVRVSREDENPENQKYAIYEWASKSGHKVINIFEDVGVSGALSPKERPGFKKCLESINQADGLIVYALDRIARSLFELYNVIKEIESMNKIVISVRESWLQTLDSKIRSLIIAILGWSAEMEREFLRERTRDALMRLKAQGKQLGRPRKLNETIGMNAIKYIEKGYSLRDVAKILNVSYGTLARFLTSNITLRTKYYEARAKRGR